MLNPIIQLTYSSLVSTVVVTYKLFTPNIGVDRTGLIVDPNNISWKCTFTLQVYLHIIECIYPFRYIIKLDYHHNKHPMVSKCSETFLKLTINYASDWHMVKKKIWYNLYLSIQEYTPYLRYIWGQTKQSSKMNCKIWCIFLSGLVSLVVLKSVIQVLIICVMMCII